jgi:hypothetical protein
MASNFAYAETVVRVVDIGDVTLATTPTAVPTQFINGVPAGSTINSVNVRWSGQILFFWELQSTVGGTTLVSCTNTATLSSSLGGVSVPATPRLFQATQPYPSVQQTPSGTSASIASTLNSNVSVSSALANTLTSGTPVPLDFVGSANVTENSPNAFIVPGSIITGIDSLRITITIDYTPAPCDDIDFNNNDVFPEEQDVIDFFNVLAGGECPACNDIDFNNNSVFPEEQDVIDFFNVLAGGTCP